MDVGVHCAGQGRGLSRGRSQVCWWFLFGPVLCSVKSEKKTAHICLGRGGGALSANSLCAPLSSRLKGLCSPAFQKVSLTCPFQEFHFRLPPTFTLLRACLCVCFGKREGPVSVRHHLRCLVTGKRARLVFVFNTGTQPAAHETRPPMHSAFWIAPLPPGLNQQAPS